MMYTNFVAVHSSETVVRAHLRPFYCRRQFGFAVVKTEVSASTKRKIKYEIVYWSKKIFYNYPSSVKPFYFFKFLVIFLLIEYYYAGNLMSV